MSVGVNAGEGIVTVLISRAGTMRPHLMVASIHARICTSRLSHDHRDRVLSTESFSTTRNGFR